MPKTESKTKTNKKSKVTKAPEVTQKTLTDWIFQTYDIDQLPKHFYIHIAKIKKGEYKGQNRPIPLTDLLDMWQRLMPKLDKIYLNNCSHGKIIEGYARISYDLSIVLSKYSSYLSWKMEQEVKRIEKENKSNEVDYTKAYQQIEENCNNNSEKLPSHKVIYKSGIDDLSEVLDEMWVSND